MYKVYCDDYLIYDVRVEGLSLISPQLELEVSKAGTFTFGIYPDHPYFEHLKKLESTIEVWQDNDCIFRGRILNSEKDFFNCYQITCEGALAYLVDSIQRPYDFNTGDAHTSVGALFRYFIAQHNANVSAKQQFTVGSVTVEDPNAYIKRADSSYEKNTLESIEEKLMDTYGGYLFVRYESDGNYIDYVEDFSLIGQPITLRENLLDLTESTKGEDLFTAIIPLGAQLEVDGETTDERLTIESVNSGSDVLIATEAAAKYGVITRTQIWDDVTVASNLKTKGQAVLDDAWSFAKSVEISAADLKGTGADVASFRIGVYSHVTSELHDINENMLVTKLSLCLDDPASDELVLGKTWASLTDKQQGASQRLGNLVETVTSVKNTAENAKKASKVYVMSTTAPEDTSLLWLDISEEPAVWKRYVYDEGAEEGNWVIINDENPAIQEMQLYLEAEIQNSADLIRTEVSETYALKTETEDAISSISSELAQTSRDITASFTEYQQDTDGRFQEISNYIRFDSDGITLGETGNQLTLKIENDQITFYDNNTAVAYWTNSKFYVVDGEFTNSLRLGKFAFIPRPLTGNLSFKKVVD